MSKVSFSRQSRITRQAASVAVEQIEARLLFHFTVVNPIADFSVAPGTASSSVDLTNVVNSDEISGTVVRFDTSLGNIDLSLFDAQKPLTVQNFLNYVNSGTYDGTFIHGAQNRTDPSPAFVPATDVILGGGYEFPGFTHVPTGNAIQDETTANGVRSNVRGTIGMSKDSNTPNTATSDWYINTGDNPLLDSTSQGGGYTAFGEVISGTLTTVDAIDAVPTFDLTAPFSQLPLRNYTQEDLDSATPFTDNNLILINNASVVPKVAYTVSSSNSSLVNPSIDDNTLNFTYGSGTGSATITLTGTGIDGTIATDTFTVGVGTLDVTVGTGGAKAVTFNDADGTVGTISIKGGAATVSFNGSGLMQTVGKKGATITGPVGSLASITLTGTNGASILTVKAKGGNRIVDIGSISGTGGLKSLSGKQVAISGDVNLGSAGKIDLSSMTGGSLTVGGGTPVSVNVGPVQDSDFDISAPVKSMKLASFGGGSNHLNGGSISKLTIAGTLGSDINGGALGSLKAGSIANSDIRIDGPIGKISARGITGSTIFSRVSPTSLPDAGSDLGAGGSISSVSNKGAFSNSSIAALVLGKLSLGTITTANGGTAFGVAGDTIASLSGTDSSGSRIKLSRLTTADQTFTRGDFEARVF